MGMTVIDQRIAKMKEQNIKLAALFADPHPGLLTWLSAVRQATIRLVAIMDGKED
jgi:hypothetical protein